MSKRKSKQPAQRTLERLREDGIPCAVASRWNPYAKRSVDLFGFIDIEALDLENIEAESYDTIIINSVTQHFPSVDYLLRALGGAVQAVQNGGAIFIGDVRCLPLLEVFHTDIEFQRAADTLPLTQLLPDIERRVKQEKELWIDPAVV